jgi:hypothetical protein
MRAADARPSSDGPGRAGAPLRPVRRERPGPGAVPTTRGGLSTQAWCRIPLARAHAGRGRNWARHEENDRAQAQTECRFDPEVGGCSTRSCRPSAWPECSIATDPASNSPDAWSGPPVRGTCARFRSSRSTYERRAQQSCAGHPASSCAARRRPADRDRAPTTAGRDCDAGSAMPPGRAPDIAPVNRSYGRAVRFR